MWPLHVWAPNAPSSQHLIKLFIRDNNKNYGDRRAKLPMLLPPPMNLKRSLKVMVCVPCCTQTDSCKGLPGSVLDFTNGYSIYLFVHRNFRKLWPYVPTFYILISKIFLKFKPYGPTFLGHFQNYVFLIFPFNSRPLSSHKIFWKHIIVN